MPIKKISKQQRLGRSGGRVVADIGPDDTYRIDSMHYPGTPEFKAEQKEMRKLERAQDLEFDRWNKDREQKINEENSLSKAVGHLKKQHED